MSKKITFIIPVYNAEKTINAVITNIKNQKTEYTKRIIVIDDCSIDKTKDIIKRIDGIEYYKLKKNTQSPGIVRNIGIKKVKTEYTVFIDSDILLEREWLSKLLKYIGDPQVVGVTGNLRVLKSLIKKYPSQACQDFSWILNHDYKKQRISFCDFLPSSNVIYKTKIIKKYKFNSKCKSVECIDLGKRLTRKGYKLLRVKNAKLYHIDYFDNKLLNFLKKQIWYSSNSELIEKKRVLKFLDIKSYLIIILPFLVLPFLFLDLRLIILYPLIYFGGLLFVLNILINSENLRDYSLNSILLMPLVFYLKIATYRISKLLFKFGVF